MLSGLGGFQDVRGFRDCLESQGGIVNYLRLKPLVSALNPGIFIYLLYALYVLLRVPRISLKGNRALVRGPYFSTNDEDWGCYMSCSLPESPVTSPQIPSFIIPYVSRPSRSLDYSSYDL